MFGNFIYLDILQCNITEQTSRIHITSCLHENFFRNFRFRIKKLQEIKKDKEI